MSMKVQPFVLSLPFSLCLLSCAAPGPSPIESLIQTSLDEVAKYGSYNQKYLQTSTEAALIDASLETTRNQLKDPGSAQFRNVRVAQFGPGKVVCGEINGKNSYGGYVGFRSFAASPIGATIQSTGNRYPEIDEAANSGIGAACGLR